MKRSVKGYTTVHHRIGPYPSGVDNWYSGSRRSKPDVPKMSRRQTHKNKSLSVALVFEANQSSSQISEMIGAEMVTEKE